MSDSYTNIILEDINGKFQTLIEAFRQMQAYVKTLATQQSLDELATEVAVIKHAVTETNHDLAQLERRVTKLESSYKS